MLKYLTLLNWKSGWLTCGYTERKGNVRIQALSILKNQINKLLKLKKQAHLSDLLS